MLKISLYSYIYNGFCCQNNIIWTFLLSFTFPHHWTHTVNVSICHLCRTVTLYIKWCGKPAAHWPLFNPSGCFTGLTLGQAVHQVCTQSGQMQTDLSCFLSIFYVFFGWTTEQVSLMLFIKALSLCLSSFLAALMHTLLDLSRNKSKKQTLMVLIFYSDMKFHANWLKLCLLCWCMLCGI